MRKQKVLFLFVALAIVFASCDDFVSSTKSLEAAWQADEDHYEEGRHVYNAEIEYDPSDSSKLRIYNFMGIDPNLESNLYVSAFLNGAVISIPSQEYKLHRISGSGEISGNYKTITFSFNDDLYKDGGGTVTSIWTKLDY